MLNELPDPCPLISEQRNLALLCAYGTLVFPQKLKKFGWQLNKLRFSQYFRFWWTLRTGCHSDSPLVFLSGIIYDTHVSLFWVFLRRMELISLFCRSKSLFQLPGPQGHPLLELPHFWASIFHPISMPYHLVSLFKAFGFSLVQSQLPQRLFWGDMRIKRVYRFLCK